MSLKVGYFVWRLGSLPKDVKELIDILYKFDITTLAFKVLDGKFKFNVPDGDKPLKRYIDELRKAGFEIEAWGYHYPSYPTLQAEAIEERRKTFDFKVYHLNCEKEWKTLNGKVAAKLLLDKLDVESLKVYLCSYRFPSFHREFPFKTFMDHPKIIGASPQIYWALSHNPAEQCAKTFQEYSTFSKIIYPIGSAFGESFKVGEKSIWWEPNVKELEDFRLFNVSKNLDKIYYYSLDWVLTRNKQDWLEASTGVKFPDPPIAIPEEKKEFTIANCQWLNGRSEPNTSFDNICVIVRKGSKVTNLKESSGNWMKVGLGPIKCWMHGDYLE